MTSLEAIADRPELEVVKALLSDLRAPLLDLSRSLLAAVELSDPAI